MSRLPPRIEGLDWDDWNRDHIEKHAVTQEEVEEAVSDRAIYRSSYKNLNDSIANIIDMGKSPSQTSSPHVPSTEQSSASQDKAVSSGAP